MKKCLKLKSHSGINFLTNVGEFIYLFILEKKNGQMILQVNFTSTELGESSKSNCLPTRLVLDYLRIQAKT